MRVTLFDGGGDEFPAVVERIGRADVELAIVARESVDRELPFDLTLAGGAQGRPAKVARGKGGRNRRNADRAAVYLPQRRSTD